MALPSQELNATRASLRLKKALTHSLAWIGRKGSVVRDSGVGGRGKEKDLPRLSSWVERLPCVWKKLQARLRKGSDPKELWLAAGEHNGSTGHGRLGLGGSAQGDRGSARPRFVLVQVCFSPEPIIS